MTATERAQADAVLAAFRRLHPKCSKLTVRWREGRLYVCDPESALYWEAVPGGATRDPSGYGRPDTIAFYQVAWADEAADDVEEAGAV